ncbi:hypothetical protein HanPSC8_Chr02g0083671 [Helianthus annuus]|nr:hypothetical protein HanPSC8_Chr02g0083671 [Helianthus annuus]
MKPRKTILFKIRFVMKVCSVRIIFDALYTLIWKLKKFLDRSHPVSLTTTCFAAH